VVSRSDFPYSFGWLPDLPDPRDYTSTHPKIAPLLAKKPVFTPKSVDLRAFCPPICDQGQIGSCTANAAAGMLEYYRKRAYGKDSPTSRMFIYKCTRDLMMAKGDSGAYIRTTMGSLALFGAPPEKYWDYDSRALDRAPPAFCYSFAQNYQAISYFRLDDPRGQKSTADPPDGSPPQDKQKLALTNIKETLAQQIPAMFGFQVYESIRESMALPSVALRRNIRDANDGKIPYPERGEKVIGGHAVLCVGYDDAMKIGDKVGAFLIRNSWGEGWGEKGYGWLPYNYLLAGLAQDWWALVKAEWMETGAFGI